MQFFLIFGLLFFNSKALLAQVNCRDDLPNRIFLKLDNSQVFPAEESNYVDPFIHAYDSLPPPLQKWMCEIQSFKIDSSLNVSAYADYRFRKGLFDQKITVDHWNSWKDQINFGIPNAEPFDFTFQLPFYESNLEKSRSFIYFLLLHEMAHNIEKKFRTLVRPQWDHMYKKSSERFKYKYNICFYQQFVSDTCKNSGWSPSEISNVYSSLYSNTDFLTLYGSTSPREDFADSFAFYVMSLNKNFRARLIVQESHQTTSYNIVEKLKDKKFEKKLKIISDVYSVLLKNYR